MSEELNLEALETAVDAGTLDVSGPDASRAVELLAKATVLARVREEERDRLRDQVQGGRRLRFKLAGRNTRLRGVIEDAVAVFGAEEMDYDAWTEALGRMRRSLDVDDVLNFGVEGGEVAGPTSPEYDAVVNQLMDVADERDRLRNDVERLTDAVTDLRREVKNADEHWDLAEAERDGLRERSLAWQEEGGRILELVAPGSPGVNSSDELVDLVAGVVAERDRLRSAFEGVQALLDERTDRWALAIAERDTAEAERDRLRKTLAGIRLWFGVVDDETLVRLVRRAVDERDRLRAVVERFQEANAATLAACTSDQSTAALEEYRAAVDALLDLDVSGIMGGGDG